MKIGCPTSTQSITQSLWIIFLLLIVNNCLVFTTCIGCFIVISFLNISTAVKIEKTDENCIYRGKYVGNCIKTEFTTNCWSFIMFFSNSQKTISHWWNKRLIRAVKLFAYRLFFLSQDEFSTFIVFIFHFHDKMTHLCFFKHFYHRACNFHRMFVASTDVDLISN